MHLPEGPGQDSIHVHAVFAGEQGNLKSPAQVPEGPAGPHQLGRLVLAVRIVLRVVLHVGPAEVIHPADMGKHTAHGQDTAHGLVDGHRHHVVGVDGGVGRVEGQAQGQTFRGLGPGPDQSGVPGHLHLAPHQGFEDAGPLDFVVVLAVNPLPGADIGPVQQGQERGLVVRHFSQHRLLQPALRGQPLRGKLPGGKIFF